MNAEALLEECRERQEDEIVALESIFASTSGSEADLNIRQPSEPRVKLIQRQIEPVIKLCLPITLPRPTRILVDTFTPLPKQQIANGSHPTTAQQSTPVLHKNANPIADADRPISHPVPGNKRHHARNPKRKAGHLNAAANAFQPNTPASAPSSGRKGSSVQGSSSPPDDTADALGRLSLRSKNPVENGVIHRSAATPTEQQSQPSSTNLLPALVHLAPITLRVRLPSTYPAEQPPIIEELTATWLSSSPEHKDKSLAWILRKLDEQYQELSGMEVLYIWATYLSESMWNELLQDPNPAADQSSGPPFFQPADVDSNSTEAKLRFQEHLSASDAQPRLASQLLAHSRLCSQTTFDAASFDCAICLETRKGRACTRLTGCGHVFCSDCLAGYLSSLVDDGMHRQAKRCPDPECVALWSEREKNNLVDQEGNLITPAKAKSLSAAGHPISNGKGAQDADSGGEQNVVVGLVTRTELEEILGAIGLAKLDALTVKAKMEADPSVSYCPRAGCQAPVVRLATDENSGHWERFRECLSCSFAFCAWCSRSWHGPTSCPVSFQSELIRRYLSLPPGSPSRHEMEQKFGRKTLETMVRKFEEEQQTQQWLSDYTTPCPTCGIAIEKSYGCNHMTCKSCQTHYCYLCGKPISSQNPYQHFNTPGYECYHRLFDGLLGDQAPQLQREQEGANAGEAGADGRPGFALLLDENGIPIHLEPEDGEMDLLAWQQFG